MAPRAVSGVLAPMCLVTISVVLLGQNLRVGASAGTLSIGANTVASLIPFPGPCIQATFDSASPFNAWLLEDAAAEDFASHGFVGTLTSALQYQGFCGNVTSCQFATSGLSVFSNYTILLSSATSATISHDLSLTCVNNVDPYVVMVFATLPASTYSALPVQNTACYSYFTQPTSATQTIQSYFASVGSFLSNVADVRQIITSSAEFASCTATGACYTSDYPTQPAGSYVQTFINTNSEPVDILYATYPYCGSQNAYFVDPLDIAVAVTIPYQCFIYDSVANSAVTTALFQNASNDNLQLVTGSGCEDRAECVGSGPSSSAENGVYLLVVQNNSTRPASGVVTVNETRALGTTCNAALLDGASGRRKLLGVPDSQHLPSTVGASLHTPIMLPSMGEVAVPKAAAISKPSAAATKNSMAGGYRKLLQQAFTSTEAVYSPLYGYSASTPFRFGSAASFSQVTTFLPGLYIADWPESAPPLGTGVAEGGLQADTADYTAAGGPIVTLASAGASDHSSPTNASPATRATPAASPVSGSSSSTSSPSGTTPGSPPSAGGCTDAEDATDCAVNTLGEAGDYAAAEGILASQAETEAEISNNF